MKIKAGELTQEHVGWINLSDPDNVRNDGKQIYKIGMAEGGLVDIELDHGMLYKFEPDHLLLHPDDEIEIEEWIENE